MKKYKISAILLSMIMLTSCNNNATQNTKQKTTSQENAKIEEKYVNDKFFFLNSIMTIKVYDENADTTKINEEVKQRVEELENKFTINKTESEVININEKSGIEPVKVSDDTYTVIKRAIEYGDISGGKFDISIGDLVKVWGINTDHEKVPTPNEIKSALSKVNYKNIELDKNNKTVFLKEKGMAIDLGAIAKGYVSDEINKILEENNIESAVTNLGGNIYVYGSKNGNDYFKVGIRNPLSQDPNEYLGILNAKNESIVTSGIYERFFIQDGTRYHHILSTEDGYPIKNNLLSTSIITKSSMDADALSTTTFALGLKKGLDLIENTPDTEAIFVTDDKKVYITSGLKNRFVLDNKKFKIAN